MSLLKPSPLADAYSPLLAKLTVGSRLHFGLLNFDSDDASFGGVGMMIQRPGLEVHASFSPKFIANGPLASRIEAFAQLWQQATLKKLPTVRLSTRGELRDHVGLGCGTQLGLAIGTLLSKLTQHPLPDLPSLVDTVGRAKRSAIGCYGFLQGGFLFETGHQQEEFPDLAYRGDVPESWRIVLATQQKIHGRHGHDEEESFRQLDPVPPPTTSRLRQLIEGEMTPGLEAAEIDRFGEAVYEYGCLAGDCYGSVQGGRYANPTCTELVQRMRAFGIAGVGQSSWGPTIFGICEDIDQAQALCTHLHERYSEHEMHLEISEPNNHGAQLEWASTDG
ncbi:hypothetical protein AB1L30_13335 [Bremerella sp. JC817]|uniref:hypothetical protein n=1 Tax=Bremerella sp. JC817 TaxID=3231756 RepID=UPI003458B5A0